MQQVEWYGNPRGYNITYLEVRTNKSKSISIDDHTANSYVLENMEEFALYEVTMSAYNDVGSSTLSPKAVERTREYGMLKSALFKLINFKLKFSQYSILF